MRIAYIMSENINRIGGGTIHFMAVANGLCQLGHDVTIVAPQYFRTIRRFKNLKTLFVPLPGRSIFSFLLYQLLMIAIFPFLMLLHRPQAIMIRSCPGMHLPLTLLARLFGVGVVSEINGVPWTEMESRNFPGLLCWGTKFVMGLQCRLAGHIIGVTQEITDETRAVARVAPEHAHAIPNGATPEEFDRALRPTVRARMGLSDQEYVVGMVSLFTPWHGIIETIQSSLHLPPEIRPHVRYILVGAGDFYDKAKQLVESLGLTQTVLLPGMANREQVRDYLAAFDIGLFISTDAGKKKFPGSPLKFFEYLAASLPVLVTDDAHLTPMVTGDRMGTVLQEVTPQTIAQALADAYRNREKFDEIGRNNRLLAEQKYSWLSVCRQVTAVLEEAQGR